jgi:hypothetical protein
MGDLKLCPGTCSQDAGRMSRFGKCELRLATRRLILGYDLLFANPVWS